MAANEISQPKAIIELGGKQYLVSAGKKIEVNRLTDEVGATVKAPDMLGGSPVELKVLAHTLGEKIRGLKFKNKVRYIRHYGHRQHLTELEVLGGSQVKSEAKTAAKKEAAAPKPVKKVTKKPTTPSTGSGRANSVKKAAK